MLPASEKSKEKANKKLEVSGVGLENRSKFSEHRTQCFQDAHSLKRTYKDPLKSQKCLVYKSLNRGTRCTWEDIYQSPANFEPKQYNPFKVLIG